MQYHQDYYMVPYMIHLYLLCLKPFVHLVFYHCLLGHSVFVEDHFKTGKKKQKQKNKKTKQKSKKKASNMRNSLGTYVY